MHAPTDTQPMASKGERTRTDIVDCAVRLFYEHGYDGTSFTDIVEASGLYRGHIYHYFKSKDDILRAVVERHLASYRAMLADWDARARTPRARLHAFVAMVAGQGEQLARYGCPIGSLNTELGKDRRDLQAAARQLFDVFRDWLAAQWRGLGYERDAGALALHLLGRAEGIALLAHVYQDADLLRRETTGLDAWVDALADAAAKRP